MHTSVQDIKEYPTVQASASPTAVILGPINFVKAILNIGPLLTMIGIGMLYYWMQWFMIFFIVDGIGILDFQWVWDILDPDQGKEGDTADKWVELNTSWVGIAMDTLAKAKGPGGTFDYTDKKDMESLMLLSYPLLHANMWPSTTLEAATFFYTIIGSLIAPGAYADENGMVRDGWPSIMARTVQFQKMMLLDYETFLSNPEGNDLPWN